jgi:hypothetical protein
MIYSPYLMNRSILSTTFLAPRPEVPLGQQPSQSTLATATSFVYSRVGSDRRLPTQTMNHPTCLIGMTSRNRISMSIISLLAAYGVSNFKQGFCRDINAYPVLNDNKHFNNCHHSVISQARAHNVSDVFDSDYTPKTEEEKQLFKAKQEFVSSMFNRCVQTNTGKSIVRSHKANFDAQTVYSKLVHTAK